MLRLSVTLLTNSYEVYIVLAGCLALDVCLSSETRARRWWVWLSILIALELFLAPVGRAQLLHRSTIPRAYERSASAIAREFLRPARTGSVVHVEAEFA
jgi:hypothetical protein